MGILIKNADIIYGRELKPMKGNILIEGENIAEVTTDEPVQTEGMEVIDASNKLVIPGLVNAHLHSDENLFKGQFDNLPLELWMLYTYPTLKYGPFSERLIYLRTMLGAMEMVKSGITLAQDDVSEYPYPTEAGIDAVMKAYEDLGMRASVTTNLCDKQWKDKLPYIGEMLPESITMQFPDAPRPEKLYELVSQMVNKWHTPGGLINVVLAPVAPQRCSDEFFLRMTDLAEKYDLPVHTHVLETKMQYITGLDFYGETIIEHMARLGVLSGRTTIIHSVWPDDRDIELMGRAGVSVVHNPTSNLKLGSGIMPYGKLKNAGINIALGTDGMSSNEMQNIFEAMKLGALLHKITDPDYNKWPAAKELFIAATQGGAISTKRQAYTGVISEGMRADLVIIDTNTTAFTPANDYLNQLVYCENGDSVETVIIDGKVIVRGKRIVTVNEAELLDELRSYMPEFKKRYEETRKWADKLFPYVNRVYNKCANENINLSRWA